MEFLDKLLNGVTVDWKTLGEVTSIKTGQSVNKQMISANPGEYPVINSGREPLGFINEWNTDNDPIGITSRGAGVGSVTWQPGKYFRGNLNYCVTIKNVQLVNTRYLYHLLLEMQPEIQSLCTYDGIPALNASNLKELQVPIPCPENPKKSLEIQAEIVRTLDAFTAHTAELTAELTARKKQYNYYRDKLLSFEDGEVELKKLEEICQFRRGSFPQPYGNSEWYDGEESMPFVQVADVADNGFLLNKKTNQQISKLAQSKSVFVKAGTVIVSLQGTIGRVAITQYDSYVDRTLAIFSCFKVGINLRFFAYQLKAKFDKEKEFARGSTLKTITKEEFSKFEIIIPSIEEQNRIVSILDSFDTLAQSLSHGLPREIELRQKQYEYYRDLLLSFPKPETAKVSA